VIGPAFTREAAAGHASGAMLLPGASDPLFGRHLDAHHVPRLIARSLRGFYKKVHVIWVKIKLIILFVDC
jgi:hypothetical protein